jgi:hypothetical protein
MGALSPPDGTSWSWSNFIPVSNNVDVVCMPELRVTLAIFYLPVVFIQMLGSSTNEKNVTATMNF